MHVMHWMMDDACAPLYQLTVAVVAGGEVSCSDGVCSWRNALVLLPVAGSAGST